MEGVSQMYLNYYNTFFYLNTQLGCMKICLTVAMTTGGGSRLVSLLSTEMCSIFSQAASSLHHDTLARTFSGCLISSQHGPLIFLSRRNVSRDDVFAPNMWENVLYFFPVGGGPTDACVQNWIIISISIRHR